MSIRICIVILFFFTCLASGQEIHIHSISDRRQPTGESGYTLDGEFMVDSRKKLLNRNNFSDTGLYAKEIVIHDLYDTTGSLKYISQVQDIDIFFFGSFNKDAVSYKEITTEEIDSLYYWSKGGGKLIIAEQCNTTSYHAEHLGRKWGYDLVERTPLYLKPTDSAKKTSLFDGPFGEVGMVSQGGQIQGFVKIKSGNKIELATDKEKSTLIFDCEMRDFILPDVDIFTWLGGLSQGAEIKNNQDRFWANLIAYMDSMNNEPLNPRLTYNGTILSTGKNVGYQWLYNWENMESETDSSITPREEGYYRVIINDDLGCVDTSNAFMLGNPQNPVVNCLDDITIPTSPGVNYALFRPTKPQALDSDGIMSIQASFPDTFPLGRTEINWTITDSAGYSTPCTQNIYVVDEEPPKFRCFPWPQIDVGSGIFILKQDISPPEVTDNVGIIQFFNDVPDTISLGRTSVVWTAVDAAGNQSTCEQMLIIEDHEIPSIFCNPDTVIAIHRRDAAVLLNLAKPTYSDNDYIVTLASDAPDTFLQGITRVLWTVTDRSGNADSCVQTVTVQYSKADLIIPNFISPNGDGLNDYFKIENLEEDCTLTIFDEAENIRYYTQNYQNDWEGYDDNGTQLPSGIYWYVLSEFSGERYSGFIMIKRE